MTKPMTDEEIASFWNYAKENMTEEDGTQCQWADYTVRLIENFRRLREELEIAQREAHEFESTSTKLRKVVDAAKECVEVNDDGSYRLLVLDYDLGVFQKLYNALRELDERKK